VDATASVSVAAGLAGTLLTVGMVFPQTVRIWTTGSARGVSVGTWILFCFSFSLWIGYGVRTANTVNLICNILTAAASAALLLGMARIARTPPVATAVGFLLLVALCVTLGFVGHAAPLAAVTPVLVAGVLVRAPQLARSARTYRASARSDVSRLTWWASLTSGACWFLHGALRPDHLIVVTSSGALLLSSAVLAFELAADRAHAAGTSTASTADL
jgi:MtN3 and saliva related transmembrane protein